MTVALRVGIIGAGWAAESHATAFLRLPNIQIAALWSRKRASAEALATRLNEPKPKVYDTWPEMIERGGVDVISIATPPTLRSDPLVMAVNHGCHVLVEKPLGVRLTGAKAMQDATAQTDKIVATVFNWRYSPGNLVAKRAVDEGRIGRVLDVSAEWRIHWLTRDFIEKRPWMKDFAKSDGTLGEGMSHDIDRVRFVTGQDYKKVASQLVTRPLPGEPDLEIAGGSSMVLASLSNGAAADNRMQLVAGLPKWEMMISGEKGALQVTHERTWLHNLNEDEAIELQPSDQDKVPDGEDLIQHTWNRLIADFVAAVRNSDKARVTVPNLPTLADGLKVQQVLSAAILSTRESRWVNLDEMKI
jgi:predicted dehydrogenase